MEAVIDKDLAPALLAQQLDADLLVIATDVDGVYVDWGAPRQRRLGTVSPAELADLDLPPGSMGPKVEAACDFVTATGNDAVIGSVADIDASWSGGPEPGCELLEDPRPRRPSERQHCTPGRQPDLSDTGAATATMAQLAICRTVNPRHGARLASFGHRGRPWGERLRGCARRASASRQWWPWPC